MPDNLINPSVAINAYSNTSNMKAAPVSGDDENNVSFSDFLKLKAAESIDTLETSEKISAKAVTGEADLTDVVQAVNAAELTLQTVVSVRDRMISAYQEIMRMPI